MLGRVKWWSKERGYGFIEYDEDTNVFVHIQKEEIEKIDFKENQKIEFELNKVGTNVFLKVLNILDSNPSSC